MKKTFSFPVLIFISVWLILLFAGRSRLFRDPGSFAHTSIGNRILDSGHLIYRDFFSFTHYGEPWIAQQWMGECLMAVIHRLAGLDGLLIVTAAMLAMLFAYLASKVACSGMNLVLASLIMALALAVSSHHYHVRPHIVTILCTTFIFSRLCDVETGRRSMSALLWLIPVFIIWANIHGGVLGGIFTLLIGATGWTLGHLRGLKSPAQDQKAVALLWLVVLLSLASILVNPYGLRLPSAWIDIMSSSAVSDMIQEHASVMTLLQHGGASARVMIALLIGLGLFYIALLAGTGRIDQSVTWYIPLVWFLLSLSRIRHAPIFAMVAVVAMTEIFPHCSWVRSLGDKGFATFRVREVPPGSSAHSLSLYLFVVVASVVALAVSHGSSQLPSTAQKWVKLDAAYWPIEILPDLQAIERSHPRGTPIFNDMLFGGFLIYHTPGLRVFIDDRCELYGGEFITKYVNADHADFEIWLEAYRFDFALLLPNSNYRKYFEENPAWRVVKDCPAAILIQRQRADHPNTAGYILGNDIASRQ